MKIVGKLKVQDGEISLWRGTKGYKLKVIEDNWIGATAGVMLSEDHLSKLIAALLVAVKNAPAAPAEEEPEEEEPAAG